MQCADEVVSDNYSIAVVHMYALLQLYSCSSTLVVVLGWSPVLNAPPCFYRTKRGVLVLFTVASTEIREKY